MKHLQHLKGQQFLFTMTYIESEVSLNHAVFAIFQDELLARKSLKAFFLQLIG